MRDVRGDFPILRRRIHDRPLVYLDSAATSLKPQPVIDAVTRFYTEHTSNIYRAVHTLAEESTERFEASRRRLARFLHAEENEVVFTRSTTESINLVRHCYPGLRRTAASALDHHSNLLPWGYGEGRSILPVTPDGRFDLDALDRALAEGLDLVALPHVGNVTGAIVDLGRVVQRAHAAGALVLVDAAQSVPHLPVDVKALDVDFLACGAHKMLGPGGVGCLYGKAEHLERMGPWLLGGHVVDQVHLDGYTMQEIPYRLEAGTPAIEAVIGWGAALEYLGELGMDEVRRHDHDLVRYARKRLADVEHVRLVGPSDVDAIAAAVTFQVEGLEAHGVARMLNNRGNVLVRSGFHCAQPLHESLQLLPTVRASFYVYNSREDVDTLAQCLEAVVQFL